MNIFLEKKILSYPLYLFPLCLITGPFLPDLILSVVFFIFFINIYLNKKISFLINDFSKLFLIFYLYIVFRSLFADEILFSLKNSFFYFRFLIFAFLIRYLFIEDYNFRKLFINIFLITLVILSLDAFIEHLTNTHWLFDKSSYPENDNNRISGLFDEEYILGGFILSLFPTLLIITFYMSQNKLNKIIIFFLVLLFCYIIIISVERSSFVKLLLLICGFIFFTSFFGTYKKKIIFFICSISLIFFITVNHPKLNERLIYHTFDLLLQKEHGNKIDREKSIVEILQNEYNSGKIKFTYFSKEHHDHATISLKMFKDNILFGHGIKMFRFKCGEKKYYINSRSCSTHSHGIVLSFLSETGIIGVVFLIITYFYLIKSILRFKIIYNVNSTILISIFVILFPSLPSGYFFNNFFSMVLYTLVGLYLGNKKIFKNT